MNGLELSRGYYEEYGRPMLENEFPELLQFIAAGFTGSGSEHYGFDDETSRDHDYEPGFCIFLPGEDVVSRRDAFLLERAYAKLPKEYCGVKRQPLSPVGGNRNGVMRTAEYYEAAVGSGDGVLAKEAWLHIPDYALAEAVNGEIFFDGFGEVTRIREGLRNMPEDILKKRIAGNLIVMAQAGQYNFARCLKHGEPEAAQLACVEFVNAAMKTAFLLNRSYMPYYKWSFRALRALPGGETLAEKLSGLLCGDNAGEPTANEKSCIIESIAKEVSAELKRREMTNLDSQELERQAYAVNDGIRDSEVRNRNIFEGA